MVTIKEIALRAGVAKSTVSNVISGNKYVSPELKQKVLDICKELDYQPNFYATLLSTKNRTNIVGLFLEEASNYRKFYSDLIEFCIKGLSKYNNNLLVYSGLNSEETQIKLTTGKSPMDGAIVLSPTVNDKRILKITKNMIPVVVIGRTFGEERVSSIDINNALLVKTIVLQMVSEGYTKICLLNSKKELTISKERNDGFNEALEERQIDSRIIYTNSSEYDGYINAINEIKNGTNAFITASEVVASGVYKACYELNKRIPEDVAIFSLGYGDDSRLSFKPKLSYAYQDYRVIGAKAVDILMKAINGSKEIIQENIDSEIHYQGSFRLNIDRSKENGSRN